MEPSLGDVALKLPRPVRPKQPRNLLISAGAGAALLAVYLLAASVGWPWNPKRGLGLTFGILGASLFVFEMAYPLRRPRARPLGKAMAWLQAHVYLGGLALLATLIHVGFALPHGPLGWALLALAVWTTLSGLIGVLLQKWIPAALAEGLSVVALYERIPELVEGLVQEADVLMEGVSERLDNLYRSQIRPKVARLDPSWAFLLDVRSGRERALSPIKRIAEYVEDEEEQKVWDLLRLYTEKLELDAHYSLQGILRGWLTWTLHVPAAGLLMGLLAVHVASWLLY